LDSYLEIGTPVTIYPTVLSSISVSIINNIH